MFYIHSSQTFYNYVIKNTSERSWARQCLPLPVEHRECKMCADWLRNFESFVRVKRFWKARTKSEAQRLVNFAVRFFRLRSLPKYDWLNCYPIFCLSSLFCFVSFLLLLFFLVPRNLNLLSDFDTLTRLACNTVHMPTVTLLFNVFLLPI